MSNHVPHRTQQPRTGNRIVLLGASNLTLSLRTVIQLMQHRCGEPSDVLVVAGHGRSYGQTSQMLMRQLPGITASGVWPHLEATDARPTYAFLTDIGNDIPYGYMPEQILKWVNGCVDRLQRQETHIVMTNLPIQSIESLSEWHYKIFRALFFPSCRLSRGEIVERARAVHGGLVDMASSKQFSLYEQAPVWFGPDAIHVRYWKRKELYRHIFERFPRVCDAQRPMGEKEPHFSGWKQRPQFAFKVVLGREYRHPQPSGRLTDATAVSLY
ncbi:MAG: hypothetical protein Q8K59_10165 [Nitrosomonas sp.]|nr:hypothetical protein [Nitrosomonas sp.]MDP1951438.1 hypothetical protein [Nitrosomonas sp.]